MRITLGGLVVAIPALIGAISSAENGPVQHRRVIIPGSSDKPVTVQIPPRQSEPLQMAEGHTLAYKRATEGTNLVNEVGEIIYSLRPSQEVQSSVVSPNGRVALLCICRHEGRGANYDNLLRIKTDQKGLAVEELWPSSDALIPERRWWVTELGAVSDDGNRLLARMGDMPNGPGQVNYTWQTWEISPSRRLGVGLTVENGQIQRSEH